jgi:hypothetical protein
MNEVSSCLKGSTDLADQASQGCFVDDLTFRLAFNQLHDRGHTGVIHGERELG